MVGPYYRPSDTTASRLVDGETVIVSLPEGEMTVLNSAGSVVWSALTGKESSDVIAASIAAEYGLSEAPDLTPFLQTLKESGLLEEGDSPIDTSSPPPPAPPLTTWEEPAVRVRESLEALAGFCGSAFDGVDPCRVDVITCDAVFD